MRPFVSEMWAPKYRIQHRHKLEATSLATISSPLCWINSTLKYKSQAETEWLKYLQCKKYRWTGTCRNNETTTLCILLLPVHFMALVWRRDIRLTSLMLFNQDNLAKWKGHAWKETAAGVSRAFPSTSGEHHLIKALTLTHKHQHWCPVWVNVFQFEFV